MINTIINIFKNKFNMTKSSELYYFDKVITEIYKKFYFDKNRIFYVCSYGGCGSYMLCSYLSYFGKVYHIHSRNPPKRLQYIGEENSNKYVYNEWFNDVEIEKNNLYKYHVIYIYKNPVNAIYSRFEIPAHLEHIECDKNIKVNDVLNSKLDLYGIEEFFDNYTKKDNRNYKIYCIKYEEIWDNMKMLNKTLNIPDNINLYPKKIETNRKYNNEKELKSIYSSLINKMDNMKFIEII
jgi:hypothetical protein